MKTKPNSTLTRSLLFSFSGRISLSKPKPNPNPNRPQVDLVILILIIFIIINQFKSTLVYSYSDQSVRASTLGFHHWFYLLLTPRICRSPISSVLLSFVFCFFHDIRLVRQRKAARDVMSPSLNTVGATHMAALV